MAAKAVKNMIKRLSRTFIDAVLNHVEPVFNEAAEGGTGDSGGVKWHGFAIIGLPGAKFHAMTGQAENTQLVRQSRIAGKACSATAMGRPDYYGDFDKINTFKM